MADNITPDSEAVPVGDDWFDQWLETGTVAQRSVPIYGRPDLFAKYEDLERRRQIAAEVDQEERSLGDSSLADIDEEINALYKQWQESKTVWYIRALQPDEIDQARDEVNFPDEPKPAEGEKELSAEARREYEREAEAANTRANQIFVARSLVKIENSRGEVVRESITPEQVKVMREKLGDQQILRLVAAAMVAATQEVSIPVPFSQSSSKSDRAS